MERRYRRTIDWRRRPQAKAPPRRLSKLGPGGPSHVQSLPRDGRATYIRPHARRTTSSGRRGTQPPPTNDRVRNPANPYSRRRSDCSVHFLTSINNPQILATGGNRRRNSSQNQARRGFAARSQPSEGAFAAFRSALKSLNLYLLEHVALRVPVAVPLTPGACCAGTSPVEARLAVCRHFGGLPQVLRRYSSRWRRRRREPSWTGSLRGSRRSLSSGDCDEDAHRRGRYPDVLRLGSGRRSPIGACLAAGPRLEVNNTFIAGSASAMTWRTCSVPACGCCCAAAALEPRPLSGPAKSAPASTSRSTRIARALPARCTGRRLCRSPPT